jgi:uncharacterized protein
MARIPVEVEKKIASYLNELQKNDISVIKAYLFGSYARGSYSTWSDIDIAIVSECFKGDRIEDKKLIRKITLKIGSDIKPIPFAPRDFNEQDPFAQEIVSTGIQLV